jgi:predicted RNase H-like nuclease (RuvC/YqgF family)
MAVNHNFRSAMGGFNREDVVRYIEYMNTKHAEEIAALNEEVAQLQLNVRTDEDIAHTEALEAQNADLTAQLEQALADKAALETKCAQLEAAANSDTHEKELEAYRRAETIERQAQERSEQMFNQAAGTLAQATTQVDEAAIDFIGIADNITSQIDGLKKAIENSKNALRDAATTMYGIRPNE